MQENKYRKMDIEWIDEMFNLEKDFKITDSYNCFGS